MDFVISLGSIAVLVLVWRWLARRMRANGRSWFLRHLAGSSAGSVAALVLVSLALAVGIIEPAQQSTAEVVAQRVEPAAVSQAEPATKWYTGGTLHKASALEWQSGEQTDKLATSADWLAALWNGGQLKPAISAKLKSVEHLKPLAAELVKQLDAATVPEADDDQNRKMYANQKMDQMAVMVMAMMGWIGS